MADRSRTRPDSIPSQTERILREENRRQNRGLTLSEIVTHYAAAHGEIESRKVSNALMRLQRRGVVEKVGGPNRRTRYAHVAVSVDPDTDSIDLVRIKEAVESLASDREEAVRASDVHRFLQENGGTDLSPDQVKTRLETLAHDSEQKRQRAHEAWSEPVVQRISHTTPGGARRVYWAPVDGVYPIPLNLNRSDAARYSVELTQQDLGMPPTKDEIEEWASVQLAKNSLPPRHRRIAEEVRSGSFWQSLNNARNRDASGDGPIHVVVTPWSSRGAYPVRYAAGSPCPVSSAAAVLVDLAHLLEPSRELEDLDLADGELPESVLAARRVALHKVAWAGLEEFDRSTLQEAFASAIAACQVRSTWVENQEWTTFARDRQQDDLRDLEDNLVALRSLILETDAPAQPKNVVTILDGPSHNLEQFEEWVLEANDLNDRSAAHWRAVIGPVRRLRGPTAGGVATDDPTRVQSWLDRSDVLTYLVRSCYLSSLGALVDIADLIIGGVLRDPDLIRGWLETEADDPVFRRGLVVALALQGHVVPVEAAWPDPADSQDAEGYIAAVALAVGDEDERIRLAESADLRADGAARRITQQALTRMELGERLGVLD